MKDEQLKTCYGKNNPFKTPEGYFESLTDRIMAQIPENEVAMIPVRKKNIWMYIAACICGLIVFGSLLTIYLLPNQTGSVEMANVENTVSDSTTYVEDMINYALISDAMVYYEYMSDEE